MKKNEIKINYGTEVLSMTEELLKACNLAEMLVDRGQEKGIETSSLRIAIKPNLVAPVEAALGGTTHAEVVEGLIRYLQTAGFRNLTIMESSWVGDRTEDAYSLCGYYRLAEKYQVEIIDIKKAETRLVDCAGMELEISVPPLDADFLINVPVLKGHCQTRMTCCLKNMKGLLPDRQKRAFHRMGLHEPIGHLSAGIHQDFILIDSICGDLSFEDGGHPVRQDRLIAAVDPVLADSYCCRLLGIDIEEVPYIGIARACGCGSSDLDDLEVTELHPPLHASYQDGVSRAVKLSELAVEVEACSACFGSLIPALAMIEEEGLMEALLFKLDGNKIAVGQGLKGTKGFFGVGNCTRGYEHFVKGCPPDKEEIYEYLKAFIK